MRLSLSSRRWLLFLGGLLARLLVLLAIRPGYDIVNFETSAQIAAHGGNLYVEQYYYNYSPLVAHLLAPLTWLPVPYAGSHRLLMTACDGLNAWLLTRISGDRRSGWFHWWNPAMWWLIATQGQTEPLALVFLLASVWRARQGKAGVWGLATLALLVKHIVVFPVLALFVGQWGRGRGSARFIASLALFGLSFAPYLPAGADRIVQRVLLYSSWQEVYGLGLLLPPGTLALFFYGGMMALCFRSQPYEPVHRLWRVLLGQFVLIYGFSTPMLPLLLTWAALIPDAWYAALTATGWLLEASKASWRAPASMTAVWSLALLRWMQAEIELRNIQREVHGV